MTFVEFWNNTINQGVTFRYCYVKKGNNQWVRTYILDTEFKRLLKHGKVRRIDPGPVTVSEYEEPAVPGSRFNIFRGFY